MYKNKIMILSGMHFKDVDLTLSPTPTIIIIFQVKMPRSYDTVNQFQGLLKQSRMWILPSEEMQ